MNKIPKIGDYITFLPGFNSKKITEIPKERVYNNFHAAVSTGLFYNTKYKIVSIEIVDKGINPKFRVSFFANNLRYQTYKIPTAFDIRFRIDTLSDKVNKLLKI